MSAATKNRPDTVVILRELLEDVKQMKTHSVAGTIILIPKADVYNKVRDYIEYCLEEGR